MDEFALKFDGKPYTAVDAGWQVNGKNVWDIRSENGEFVDSITVGPLGTIEAAVTAWLAALQTIPSFSQVVSI